MSKWCRCVKSLQVCFVKMVQVHWFRTISVEVELDCIIHLSHTTNASLIIEHSKCVIKQSEDWLMPTVNPNIYLRDGISLVNLLYLLALPAVFIRSLAG